jgi:hypothetical protein
VNRLEHDFTVGMVPQADNEARGFARSDDRAGDRPVAPPENEVRGLSGATFIFDDDEQARRFRDLYLKPAFDRLWQERVEAPLEELWLSVFEDDGGPAW